MAQTYTINDVDYTFPDVDDSDWGQNVTDWAGAISSFLLQRTGGTFTLSAAVDFGTAFGLKVKELDSKTSSSTVSTDTSAFLRLAKSDYISWRNNADGANLTFQKGTDDLLEFAGVNLVNLSAAQTLTTKTLTSPVINTGISGSAIDDSVGLGTSAIKVPTQNAVKTYVDAQLTASDLDFRTDDDTGTPVVDLDSQNFTISGGTGIETAGAAQTLTVSGTNASTVAKGVASFSSDNFAVSSGAVTIKTGGVDNDELAGSIAASKLAGSIPDSKLSTISTANKVDLGALDIDGATELGGAIADVDKLIIDDGGAGAEKSLLATRIPTYVFSGITGDVTIADGGAASIGSGVIVDADVNSSAAITQSKLNLSITNSEVNASAGIVDTKLATISTANKVDVGALDIDGATELGGALADADLLIVDDGGAGTEKSLLASRLPDYAFTKVSGDIAIAAGGAASIATGAIVDADVNGSAAIAQSKLTLSITNSEVNASAAIVDTKLATIATADKVSLTALNIDGGTAIDAVVDADLFIVDDGAGGTNKKATAAQLDTYIKSKAIVECINAQVTGSLVSVTIGTDLFSLGMYKALRAFTINEFSVTVTNEAGTSPSGDNLDIRLEKKDTGIGNTGWTELGQIDIDTSSTATSSPSISEAITSGHFIRVKPVTFPTNPPSFHLVVKGVE